MKSITPFVLAIFLLSGCIDAAFNTAYWAERHGERMSPRAYWYPKATSGDAEAQYEMGKSYCCGKRPMFDDLEALNWFCKAARQGQRDAMFEVAQFYQAAHQTEGSIIPKDDVMAYVFYSKAAENANDKAVPFRDATLQKITDEEKVRAEKLFKFWPHVGCGTLPAHDPVQVPATSIFGKDYGTQKNPPVLPPSEAVELKSTVVPEPAVEEFKTPALAPPTFVKPKVGSALPKPSNRPKKLKVPKTKAPKKSVKTTPPEAPPSGAGQP